jgi:hypothetical protein
MKQLKVHLANCKSGRRGKSSRILILAMLAIIALAIAAFLVVKPVPLKVPLHKTTLT